MREITYITNLPNVFYDVHLIAVWFYKWMHILDKGKVSLLHDPFDVVWAAILYGRPLKNNIEYVLKWDHGRIRINFKI